MAQLPHIWPGHDPKTGGLKRVRFFGQTWAQHRLNIEGYVGPLGALLAAFGPKISTPTEAWFR